MITTTEINLLYQELDKNPSDHNLLAAIADWHYEHETGLGSGLEACVKCGRVPTRLGSTSTHCWWRFDHLHPTYIITAKSRLPHNWFAAIRSFYLDMHPVNKIVTYRSNEPVHETHLAAAKAFNLLTPEQQTRLLAGDLS